MIARYNPPAAKKEIEKFQALKTQMPMPNEMSVDLNKTYLFKGDGTTINSEIEVKELDGLKWFRNVEKKETWQATLIGKFSGGATSPSTDP